MFLAYLMAVLTNLSQYHSQSDGNLYVLLQTPAQHKVEPKRIEYVEVAADKVAMEEWIGDQSWPPDHLYVSLAEQQPLMSPILFFIYLVASLPLRKVL